MNTAPLDNKQFELTIEECIDSLETLFKWYQKDNEFNYQLTVEDSPFNQLKKQIKTTLKDYELIKQTKFIVADKKISDDDLEKLKNQGMFVGNLGQCEIKPLFDKETQKKLQALEIIKNHYGKYILKKAYKNCYAGDYILLKEVLKCEHQTLL